MSIIERNSVFLADFEPFLLVASLRDGVELHMNLPFMFVHINGRKPACVLRAKNTLKSSQKSSIQPICRHPLRKSEVTGE